MTTTIERAVRWMAVAACLLLAGPVVAEESEPDFSTAETLLWMTDQLAAVARPMQLHYAFTRSGTFEPGFEDSVTFNVEAVKDNGMKSASVDFFTGERRFDVPAVDNTNVNPILKIYLQGDVYEMNRLTDTEGKSRERWRYFQRRIKLALAESATIEDVTINFDGEAYAARRVTFTPYIDDPRRELFERFADKAYSVTVAKDLPGYLYRIETVIPGDGPNTPPLIREELQLTKIAELPGAGDQSL